MTAERYFRGSSDPYFNLWHQRFHQGDRRRKPRQYLGLIRAADQPGINIAAIGNLYLLELFVTLVKFKKLPFCHCTVEMSYSFAHQS